MPYLANYYHYVYNETNQTEILHKILVKSMVISSYDPKISKSLLHGLIDMEDFHRYIQSAGVTLSQCNHIITLFKHKTYSCVINKDMDMYASRPWSDVVDIPFADRL